MSGVGNSSSATEAFLPSISDKKHQWTIYTDEEALVQYPAISFLHGNRPFRDLPFCLLFLLFVISTFAFGIFAFVNHNTYFNHVSSFFFDPTTSSCILNPSSGSVTLNFTASSSFLKRDLIATFTVTLVFAFLIALGVLWLLKYYAKHIVYTCLPFFVLIPAFCGVYWFVTCTLKEQCSHAFPLIYRILILLFVFLLIGIIIWIIVANMHRLELTIKIIQVASTALAHNLWLLVVIVLLTLGLLLYFVPIVGFLVFAQRNGEVLPKDEDGEYYCAWKQDSWVPAYFALGILTMLWSLASLLEAQVYVISGTIAQWYFTPEGDNPKGCITTSLRHAFGPSAGTICFSGLFMFIVRIVRSIVDRQHGSSGIVNLIIKWFANFVLSTIDFVNKFTINFAAITGEAYCNSAKMTYELLKRNLLSAIFVETVSTRIMAGIVFVVSTAYAIVVFIILKFGSDLGVDSYFVALLAWLVLITVLGFIVHVLDNVIDTIYVCYAIDKDKREVSKPDVHEIYVLLPISRTDRSSLSRTPMGV